MGWVRIDDGFLRHHKVVALTPNAKLLFIAGLLHCADQKTDGKISIGASRMCAGMAGVPLVSPAKELVAAGLWHKLADGYEVHDYLDYQPSSESEQQRRANHADRVRKWRERNRERSAGGAGARDIVSNGSCDVSCDVSQTVSLAPLVTEPVTGLCMGEDDSDSRSLKLGSNSTLVRGPAPPEPENHEMHQAAPDDPLVTRWLLEVVRKPDSAAARGDAQAVIGHLAQHWDRTRIDEAIGYCATLANQPKRASYLLKTCQQWAAEDHVEIPPMGQP